MGEMVFMHLSRYKILSGIGFLQSFSRFLPWVLAIILCCFILVIAERSWDAMLVSLDGDLNSSDQLLVPYFDSDSVLYTRLVAVDMLRDSLGRVTWTFVDGGADGRPVYFSQILIWGIGILSWLVSLFTGWGWLHSVQYGAWMVSPLLFCFSFLGIVGVLSFFRVPWHLICLILLIWVSTVGIQISFSAARPDHHGFLALCLVVGLFFFFSSIVFSRGRYLSSALSGGAFALMVGPGTVFVPLVLLLLVIAWVVGGLVASHRLVFVFPWRVWGFVGAFVSGGLYLLTYFPGPWPLRLEGPNPFWPFLFVAIGEIFSSWDSWISRGRVVGGRLALGGTIVLGFLVVLWYLLPFASVFDPNYLGSLRVVSDLQPGTIWDTVCILFPVWILVFVYLPVLWVKGSRGRYLALASLILFLPFLFHSSLQRRVLELAAPVGFAMGVLLLLFYFRKCREGASYFGVWLGVLVWLCLQAPLTPLVHPHVDAGLVDAGAVARDAGKVFGSDDVVLVTPYAGLIYSSYGGFKNLGSLYWENLPSATWAHAGMVSSSWNDFKVILGRNKVTGIIVLTGDSYLLSWNFYGEDPTRMSQAPSVFRDLQQGKFPSWLVEVGSFRGVKFFRVRLEGA